MTEPSEYQKLEGWQHFRSGKVRDLYIPQGETYDTTDKMLVVASDRISAFDYILPTTIPDKGSILTQISLWWFSQLSDIVSHHVLTDCDDLIPQEVKGRAIVCQKLHMFPIECVARGYLTGSGLIDYQETGMVCGHHLPSGLVEASRLETPLFTPAAKAELGKHDENITYETVEQRVGSLWAKQLRDKTIEIYCRARDMAARSGIILADTKFEFGVSLTKGDNCDTAVSHTLQTGVDSFLPDGELVLADEVLTPDSSRFWPADQWVEGRVTPSFDKQYVRDWLLHDSGWNRSSGAPAPALPPHVVKQTRQRYIDAFEKLTGQQFDSVMARTGGHVIGM